MPSLEVSLRSWFPQPSDFISSYSRRKKSLADTDVDISGRDKRASVSECTVALDC